MRSVCRSQCAALITCNRRRNLLTPCNSSLSVMPNKYSSVYLEMLFQSSAHNHNPSFTCNDSNRCFHPRTNLVILILQKPCTKTPLPILFVVCLFFGLPIPVSRTCSSRILYSNYYLLILANLSFPIRSVLATTYPSYSCKGDRTTYLQYYLLLMFSSLSFRAVTMINKISNSGCISWKYTWWI